MAQRTAKPANATALLLFGVLGTITIIGGYKLFIKPYSDATRRNNAEEFANFIYESKRKQLEEKNSQK